MKRLLTLLRALRRWKYVIQTYRDYATRLNRSAEVENFLRACASGKRATPTPEECRQLACKLGLPNEIRAAHTIEDRGSWKVRINAAGTLTRAPIAQPHA